MAVADSALLIVDLGAAGPTAGADAGVADCFTMDRPTGCLSYGPAAGYAAAEDDEDSNNNDRDLPPGSTLPTPPRSRAPPPG